MQSSASPKALLKSLLKPIYYRLPATICYGPQFSPTLRLLQESQTWDETRLVDHQISKLRAMLRHCAAHVPYYRRLFRQVGFDPERIHSLSDLAELPLLDRDLIQSNIRDFLAENIKPSRMHYFTTGGTMGKPLGLYNMRHSAGRERAFILAQWSRVGFDLADRRAMLRGWPVRNKRHWRYDASERSFVFSNFHMTAENVAEYARVIRRENLTYLHSYPSAVVDFARRLTELGLEPPRFKAILASSENLYPGQREFIETFYGARLFSWYGHTENVVLAGACEASDFYHIFPEYGVTEIIKEDGSAASSEDEVGELVGTSLANFAMPLIRYRTNDWAVIGPKSCECGRRYKLLKETRGRWHQEMLVGKLDNLISVTALNMHTDIFDNVRQLQFYQREKGKVDLRILRKENFSERDVKRILAALNEKIGDTLEVTLTFPDEIPLMPRGKFRFVIRDIELPTSFAGGDCVEASSRR